jgi:hypothetical protein
MTANLTACQGCTWDYYYVDGFESLISSSRHTIEEVAVSEVVEAEITTMMSMVDLEVEVEVVVVVEGVEVETQLRYVK